jgi:hypothetical protein
MADDSTSNGGETRSFGQRMKHGFESKILIPVAVTVVSAAVSYLMKKLPLLLEEKVLPKLQEQDGGGQVAKTIERTVETVAATTGGDAPDAEQQPEPEREATESPTMSNDAREQERRRREERRRERKRAAA